MKIFKMLLFGVIVVALFAGVYWLVVRPSSSGDDMVSGSGLRQMCVNRIKTYGDSLSVYGWKDDYLTAAQVVIDAHRNDLPAADVAHLESALQSVFIAGLDSLVRSCYGRAMTDGAIEASSKLGRAYHGLESIGAKYPAVKSSQRWSALMDLKKTHADIYAFSRRSFRQPSRIGIYTGWNGDTPYISINNVLNFNRYAQGVRGQLNALVNRRDAIAELSLSPWTAGALDRAAVDTRLNEAKAMYIESERTAVNKYLSGIMNDLHNHFSGDKRLSAADANTIIARLTNIETYLQENDMPVSGFGNVKSQIRRIYITQ